MFRTQEDIHWSGRIKVEPSQSWFDSAASHAPLEVGDGRVTDRGVRIMTANHFDQTLQEKAAVVNHQRGEGEQTEKRLGFLFGRVSGGHESLDGGDHKNATLI